jgi:Protein of unknwon function (DUF3310)
VSTLGGGRNECDQGINPGVHVRLSLPVSSPAAEKVNHPAHYGNGPDDPYEVIKVLEYWLTREEFIGALKFNVIKYQARARHKNGAEDYAKAAWYATYLADFMKRHSDA